MNSKILNKWLTLAANIGVIAGIVFLGIELQQNNEYLSAQSKYNLFQNQVSMVDQILESPRLTSMIVRASAKEELTREDEFVLTQLASRMVQNWRWEFEEYEAGRLSYEELPIIAWQNAYQGKIWPALPVKEVIDNVDTARAPRFSQFLEDNVVNK